MICPIWLIEVVQIGLELIAGFTGTTSGGKSTLAKIVKKANSRVTEQEDESSEVMNIDNFYLRFKIVQQIQGLDKLTKEEALPLTNWDDPHLIDYLRLISSLRELKQNGFVDIPVYNKDTGEYDTGEIITVHARPVLILESFLLFSADQVTGVYEGGPKKGQPVLENPEKVHQEILDLIGYRVYVDCDEETAFIRRCIRDAIMVPRDPREETAVMWERDVMPAAEKYLIPLREKGLKTDGGIFDRIIDYTLFNPNVIDGILTDLINGSSLTLNEEYRGPAPRHKTLAFLNREEILDQTTRMYHLVTGCEE